MFNRHSNQNRPIVGLLSRSLFVFACLAICLQTVSAQTFTRRNSPYSRYGLGDMFSTQFLPGSSTGGAFAAAYNSVWDINLTNPASLGHLQFTALEVGVYYKYSDLKEQSTGLKANAHDGNISYLSLAFPITRSWEVEADTLRRGIPIQWAMGFSLLPHSTVGYDARIVRTLPDIGKVEYKYAGQGTRMRANWANGVRYKGFSLGANVGVLFGTVSDKTTMTFQDSAYIYAFNEEILLEENAVGLLWDLGAQYDWYLTKKDKKHNLLEDTRLTFGAYMGGSNSIRLLEKERHTRYGGYYGRDTVMNTEDELGQMKLPLTLGFGVLLSKGIHWRIGANYEAQLWDQFSHSLQTVNMANSYQVSLGGEYTPKYSDYTNYLKRIKYRLGTFYSKDPRIVGFGTNSYSLSKYGIAFGLGLPIKPLKSAILGHANIGFELGYMGHKDLIGEKFFQVNLGFSFNDSSWFRRTKFR